MNWVLSVLLDVLWKGFHDQLLEETLQSLFAFWSLPHLLSPVSPRSSVLDLRSLYPTLPPSRVYANPLHTQPHTSRRKLLLATSAEFFPPETPFSAVREPPHPQLAACLPSVETRSLSGERGGRAGGERGSRLGRPRRPAGQG